MAAVESAKELGVKMPVGNLYSSDTFYDAAGRNMRFAKMGVMAVEMEAAGLYCTAAYTGKAGAGHLLHLRQPCHRRGAVRRRAADHLHQYDEDRAGGGGEDGRQVRRRRWMCRRCGDNCTQSWDKM